MSKELTSEKTVLKRIKATDLSNISNSQLIKFVSALPDMDKETAIKCIEQFPNFKEMANGIVAELDGCLDKIAEKNKDVQKEAIAAHRQIIGSLSKELQETDPNEDHRIFLIETMQEEASRIDELAREHQAFVKHATIVAGYVSSFVVAASVALLGVKIYNLRK